MIVCGSRGGGETLLVTCLLTFCYIHAEPAGDSNIDAASQDVATCASFHHRHHHQQQQQQPSYEDSGTNDIRAENKLEAGTQQSSPVCCACFQSSSTSVSTTVQSATSAPTLTPAHPALYPVYPPYIVMGISVQPFAYPQPSLAVPSGSRKRPGGGSNKLMSPEERRRARKQRRQHHGDVVSSTTPDSSVLESTSGSGGHVFAFPAEMTSSAEVTSPLCLTVSQDKPVYDACGALDLTVRK